MAERFRVEMAKESDSSEWDAFVVRRFGSTPFHLWGFSKSLARSYGYHFFGLVAKENNELAAVLPLLQVRSLLFGDRLISVPFSEYGGPVGEPAAFSTLISAAKKLGLQLGTKEIQFRHSSYGMNEAGGQFSKITRYVTFEVRLDKNLSIRVGKKTRNTIRRAESSSITIREMLLRDLPAFYRIYLETQKRLGSPPHSPALFENLFSHLGPLKVAKFLAAEIDGRMIAAVVLFYHRQELYWWNSVAETKYLRKNPTTLLLWKAANWAFQNGFDKLNLGRGRPYSSVYDFKSHWGGSETPLSEYIMVVRGHATRPDPEEFRFKVLSKIWSYLPIPLQRRLGPRLVKGIAL